MDRNREARRASIVGSNGFNRRRHRTNSLRDSPDEDGGVELQESVRLRERVKKDRDRERERDRERDRDLRERSSRSKRRRAERLASGGDETSEESVNYEEDDEDEEIAGGSVVAARFSSPAMGSISNHQHQNHNIHVGNHQHHSQSSNFSQQQQPQHNSNSTGNAVINNNNHHLLHRKTFPPSSSSSSAKVVRAPPPVWKPGDEMISSSVPRKARSASTKRSHDWVSSSSNNNSGGGDQNPAQISNSPSRISHAPTPTAPPATATPTSPSYSNPSIKKKLKHSVNSNSGQKLKPPKGSSSSAKPSTSNAEELEIEIAEVLYGLMTQSQAPPSSKKDEIKEDHRFNIDPKSLNSSPISNSNLGPNSSPLSAVAPKRKRPRHVPESSSLGARSSPISSKPETDQTPKSELSSPSLEKISGSAAAENGSEIGGVSVISEVQPAEPPLPTAPESIKPDSELKKPLAFELSSSKEQESPAVRDHDSNNRDPSSIATASENQKVEKFEIDLMAPPPQARSGETKTDLRASFVVEQKPVLPILVSDLKPVVSSTDNVVGKGKMSGPENEHLANVAAEEKENEKEVKLNKEIEKNNKNNKVDSRTIDLRLDLEKPDRDVEPSKEELPIEKPGNSTSSLPLPMSMASWPGGLPPMGYVAPLQGVISMDGGSVAPARVQTPVFSQPRPKRCATHCHIARNIHCLQQFTKMNPFWPPPSGSPASLFTSKPCNLSVVSPADLNVAVKGSNDNNNGNNASGKGPGPANIPSSSSGKDKSSQPSTSSESAHRKQQQILIQQALPPAQPSNLLGPTFIFPLNQQQQAAVAARSGPAANLSTTVSPPNTSMSAATSAPPMSFNYPNMTPNETQYLAILQNNAYPFPIPTMGAPPNYRGPQSHAMPMFNGSFYPSQIIHQPSGQQQQLMQAHQNATAVNNSSSSSGQKQQHIQSQQQQRPQPNNFPSQKSQPSQHNQYMQQGNEESPSANDNRGSRASVNIYGQNFAIPIHPQNFAMMTPQAAMATANNGNQAEKKLNQPHQQQQQPGLKTGVVDSLPPHTFAMSFGPGTDASSMAPSHAAMYQNSSEGARQNIQMMAAQAVQKNNSFRISEEGKSGNSDQSGKEDERSFAFSRSELADAHITSSVQPNNVIESSGRSITVGPGPARSSRSTSSGMGMNVVPNTRIQAQLQQQQQMMQQLKHHQQQQQHQQQQMAANAVNRANKQPTNNNGSVYPEHLNSSSMMAAKFQNTISPFPQNLAPSNSQSSSPSQSPQWKSSTRTPTAAAQPGPSSLGSSGPSMHKNNSHPSQQHSRNQPPMHAQISFGGGNNQQKQPSGQQGQAPPTPSSNNQVGSPTSKGTSGSPRTNSSSSMNNKVGPGSGPHGPSFPTQTNKNPPSILGNPHGSKTQSQMQQQAQQRNMQQQAQFFFSNPYVQPSQSPHPTTTSSTSGPPTGYYMPQRRPPVTLSGTSTNDPATAIAAATSNVKGHSSPFGAQPTGTLLPAGFSYVHPVPAGVQVKPAEQKQPAGNENLHHQWQPEKK
ncbi:hypothetical protein CASFOL_005352 [Castilleja foliolosa]|uniref:Protein TIME FOR COFFEE n=1 Tax=Castilleja foliolosa TaxID=1961234 RepID=A0ABD3E778_9LAMI